MKKPVLLLLLTLLCGTAYAQSNDSLVVLWLSEPGVRPAAIFTDGFESGDLSRFDANGDGTAELILQRDDSEGNLQDLMVRYPSHIDTLDGLWPWNLPDVQQTLSLSGKRTATGEAFVFWGFGDPDGDGFREAIFFNQHEVALIDPRAQQQVNWRSSFSDLGLPSDLRLLGVMDLTGDGIEEVVVALPQTRQVAVLGHDPTTVARR